MSEADYIFYIISVTQQLKLSSRINVVIKNVCSGQVTTRMLSNNFSETIKSVVSREDAYQFIGNITVTSVYVKF